MTNRPDPRNESPHVGRTGLAIDWWRVLLVLAQKWRVFAVATLIATVVGLVLGKWVVPKTYLAKAEVMWIPHPGDGSWSSVEDAMPTLFESVTLPSNILKVMSREGKLDSPVDDFRSAFKVSTADLSTVITVGAVAKTPEVAAEYANALAEVFIEQRREVMDRRLREIIAAHESSMHKREREVTASREAYDAFRATNGIKILSTDEEAAIHELARLEVLEHDVVVELEGAKGMAASLTTSRASNPESVVTARTEQRADVERLIQLEAELAQARARYTEEHPAVRALAAEVEALRVSVHRGGGRPTSQTVGRNVVHDAISTQLEQSRAAGRSLDERKAMLERVKREADARAAKLTAAEAEAARLLASVHVNEADVELLLKQIAAAEEDVRGATSDFQFVSRAIPPLRASFPIGPITAVVVPLMTFVVLLWRTVSPLRAKTATEFAYFARAPVLWSASWPLGPAYEGEVLARELAEIIGQRKGVIGFTASRDDALASDLVHMVARHLKSRGASCGILEPPQDRTGCLLADVFEHKDVGLQLRSMQERKDHVLFVLPSLADGEAVRAARRWLDGVVVVASSGDHHAREIARIRATAGISDAGLALALVGVDSALLVLERTAGEARALWRHRPVDAT